MKVKRSSSSSANAASKKLTPMNEETERFIGSVMAAENRGLLELLEPLVRADTLSWPFGRSDLHHWAEVLDKFDEMYGKFVTEFWDATTGIQSKSFGSDESRVVVAMLGFTRCLLEYCSSRNLFNSYEHLRSFLSSTDGAVLEATLELLSLPARKLDAQASLRKTFQEVIGVEALAVLGKVNHPPFIEFHRDPRNVRPFDLEAFRALHDREQIGAETVRLLSISIYLLFMSTLDIELDSSLFATSPTIIGDTARSLSTSLDGKRETAVLSLLRAALKIPSKSGEVVYALNLAAGHGPIANITRVVCEAIKEQADPPYHHFFLSAFLDLLTALALSVDADLSLTQSGIVDEIVRSLGNCLPRHYKIVERLLTVTDVLMHRLSEALDSLLAVDGLSALVQQIQHLVVLPELGFSEGALLNSHLRLIDRLLMDQGGDDRLRNLVESNLFKSLRTVFEQPAKFIPETLAHSVSILSSFIHHEPTSLTFLQEQGVPEALLSVLQNHPIPAQSDLIVRLPQAFSALCLNPAGVAQFTACNPSKKLLELFLKPDIYLKALKTHMAANELGHGLDEFMRHQPAFRDDMIKALLDVLEQFPALLSSSCTSHKLAEEPEVAITCDWKSLTDSAKKREPCPILTAFDLFTITLEGILQSPAHSAAFLAAGGLNKLLSVYSTPGLPYDFTVRAESHSISHLFRLLHESEPTVAGDGVSVLAAAWKHVFACSHQVQEHFLRAREINPSTPFFFTGNSFENEVFENLSSLLAILGLFGDLYMQANSYAAMRQAHQVIAGLVTAEGEAAMVFLSLLLSACIAEHALVEQSQDPRLISVLKTLEQPESHKEIDLTTVVPALQGRMRNVRAVLFVTGRLPGLVMNILGGVSRMVSYLSRTHGTTTPASLQKVAGILGNCLSSNLRASIDSERATFSMLALANSLFFDETSNKLSVQVVPLTAFAEIGGLADFQAVSTKPEAIESLLVFAGRLTSAQTWRPSSWEDLAESGFPSGLDSAFAFARDLSTALWQSYIGDDLAIWRLLLALTTNLLLACPEDAKPHEKIFYEKISLFRPVNLDISLVLGKVLGRAELTYDLGLLLLHAVPTDQWNLLVSSLPHRMIAVLLNSHRRAELYQYVNFDASPYDPSTSPIVLGQLLELGPSDDLQKRCALLLLEKLPSVVEVAEAEALLFLAISLTRSPLPMTIEIGQFITEVVRLALLGVEDVEDIRFRSMPSMTLIVVRQLIESSQPGYLELLMEPELVSKFRSTVSRRSTVLPAFLENFSDGPIQRDRKVFLESVKKCFAYEGPSGLADVQPKEELRISDGIMDVENRRAHLDKLYSIDACPIAKPVVESLIDQIMACQVPPIFESAEATLEAEKNNEALVKDHFKRTDLLMILSELVASLPACHTALMESDRFNPLLSLLFDRVVPCGDLAVAGLTPASGLFVSGPVWVDFFLGQVCVGSSVPGLPAPLDRIQASVRRVIGVLHETLLSTADGLLGLPTGYARMSRVWCLSMTVYSLLNMRGGIHRQTEAVQSAIAKAMLEAKFIPALAGLLGRIRVEWPGHAMVSAKLVLNLELLVKQAKSLLPKPPRQTSITPLLEAGTSGAPMIDSGMSEDDSEGDQSHSSAMMEPEEFGYAQESSESSIDEMEIDLDDDDTGDDDDDGGDDSEGMMSSDDGSEESDDEMTGSELILDSSDSMDMDSDDSDDTDGVDDDDSDYESVHIIMQPGTRSASALDLLHLDPQDIVLPENNNNEPADFFDIDEDEQIDDFGDILDGLNHQHGRRRGGRGGMWEIDDEIDMMDDGFDDEDDMESAEDDLLFTEDEDDDEEADEQEDGNRRIDAINITDRLMQRSNNRFGGAFGGGGVLNAGGEAVGFNSLAARGATSGDLYVPPVLGRPIDAPACLSTRLTDLALFINNQTNTNNTNTINSSNVISLVRTPFKMPTAQKTSSAFRGNREALRNPAVIPTSRRWVQASHLIHSCAMPSVVPQEVLESVRAALRPGWDEALERMKKDHEASMAAAAASKEKVAEKHKEEENEKDGEKEKLPEKEKEKETEVVPATVTEEQGQEAPVEEIEWIDNGPDVDFLLALPFDMRSEVIQQYFAQERRTAMTSAMPNETSLIRVVISPAFLARLPEDIRQEYQRLSDRDAERFNRRRRGRRNGSAAMSSVHSRIMDLIRERTEGHNDNSHEDNEEEDEDGDDFEAEMDAFINNRSGTGTDERMNEMGQFVSRLAASIQSALGGTVDRVEVLQQPQGPQRAAPAVPIIRVLEGGLPTNNPPAEMAGGKLSPLPTPILALDRQTLATLLLSYYDPTMSDKRTHHKLLTNLCSLPLHDEPVIDLAGGTEPARVREELIGMLILVLERMPNDLDALLRCLSGTTDESNAVVAPSPAPTPTLHPIQHQHQHHNHHNHNQASSSSSTGSVVVLQRTLQLLTYLVSHDEACKHYFTRPSATPWTIRRRTDKKTVTTHEIRFPIVLLLACLEKPQFLQVGLLVEFLLGVLSMVSGPLRALGALGASGALGTLSSQQNQQQQQQASGSQSQLQQLLIQQLQHIKIPTPFLHALVKALGASELTPKAFNHATSIFQNLAKLEGGVAEQLLTGLSEATLKLLDQVGKDLVQVEQVLPSNMTAQVNSSSTEVVPAAQQQNNFDLDRLNEALKVMSSPTAAQTRLLRLMKMILTLKGNADSASKAAILKDLKAPGWSANLIDCLPRILSRIGIDQLHVSLGLLPAIETFFLHARLVHDFDPESVSEENERLIGFAEDHRKLLNAMIRTNPSLLTTGSFNSLTQAPRVLDFDNKRAYFKSQLASLKKASPTNATAAAAAANVNNVINLNVRRAYIFEDSYHQLIGRTGEELRAAKLNVKFHGEEGVDAGGVSREWYSDLCKKMFNPDNGLFVPSAGDKIALQPNRMSWVNPDHLHFFSFVGRILGKAIIDSRLLDCHFTRSFYKHLLGLPVDMRDLEAVDPDYYKSLCWILENDITGVLDDDLTFTAESDEFGVVKVIDLIPAGNSTPVTEANKSEYVRLIVEYKLTEAIRPQIDAVLRGLHALIPPSLLVLFTETELELLISGLPDIDIDDWRANTDYKSYTIASPQVQWFWRAVRSFDPEERAKLVQFVTGTSKVPLEGWSHLQGSSGRQRFTITKDFGPTHRLPSAHTCFNQLDLPAYESYEEERRQLLKAITEGATGFGLI